MSFCCSGSCSGSYREGATSSHYYAFVGMRETWTLPLPVKACITWPISCKKACKRLHSWLIFDILKIFGWFVLLLKLIWMSEFPEVYCDFCVKYAFIIRKNYFIHYIIVAFSISFPSLMWITFKFWVSFFLYIFLIFMWTHFSFVSTMSFP